MQTLLLFIFAFWIITGIVADLTLTFTDRLVKKHWLNVWYLHTFSIIGGTIYLYCVLEIMLQKISANKNISTPQTVDKFNKS